MTVTAVIASGLSAEAKNTLKSYNIDILDFGINPSLDKNVAFHSDLSFLTDGKDTLFIANEMIQYKSVLKNYFENIIVIPEKLGKKYPADVALNCVVIGNSLICNVDTVSSVVLEYFKENQFRIIDVRQGYTKCSVIPVADNAIITDDPSVASVGKENGFDVLFISKGSVNLAGYGYGFIGGASGIISDDVIAFCGDINSHKDSAQILGFLKKYNITALSLDNRQLYDIGSIIPLFGGLS